ncbi:MAG: hypothetical protein GY861_01425 [bacterium]|nr:hypothetical protein [bacterium]
MAENSFKKAIAFSLMGMGGGLTGQNYIKNYLDSIEEDKLSLGDQAISKLAGLGDYANVTAPTSGGEEAMAGYTGQGGQIDDIKLRYSPLEGTAAKKLVGLDPKSIAELEVAKQAQAQGAKAGELAERDVIRASAAIDTSWDTAIDFGSQQFDNLGLRPGQFLGIVDKLTPSEYNDYKDAFIGAGKESASLIARQLIPGVRAANITEIFSKSTAQLGATMEANAANISASMGNAWGNALAQNIEVVTEDGNKARIQDITIDEETGKPISQLPFGDKLDAVNRAKRKFQDDLQKKSIDEVYKRDPRLLKPETIKKLESKQGDTALLESMGFDSNEFEIVGEE